MAKSKSRKRNRRKKSSGPKSWVLLFSGLVLGLFIALLLFLNYQSPAQVASITPPASAPATPVNPAKPVKVEEVESKYQFYGALPSSQVVVPKTREQAPGNTLIIQDEKEYSNNYSSFNIQVGSFKSAKGADQQKASLTMLGYEPNIEKTRLHDGSIVHRVILGPFSDIASASKMQTRLHSQKIENTLLKSE